MPDTKTILKHILNVCSEHPAINGTPVLLDDDGGHKLVFNMKVNLPSMCEETNKDGIRQTDKGVREIEVCTVHFDAAFPSSTPEISLREDFCPNFPHINPAKDNRGILPCVYEGSLTDLMHSSGGFTEVLNHLTVWLNRAATNSLMDPTQGWEPIRRDRDSIACIVDEKTLKGVVNDSNELGTRYFYHSGLNERLLITDLNNPKKLYKRYQDLSKAKTKIRLNEDSFNIGIFAWSKKDAVCGVYFPDIANDFKDLYRLAKSYGVEIEYKFQEAIDYGRESGLPIKMTLILAVRRPLKLIGTDSKIELISYFIELNPNSHYSHGTVQPIVNIFTTNPEMLSNLSGISIPNKIGKILLFGAGSLGSKIAVCLARCGFNNFEVYDKSALTPHNQARHALFYDYDHIPKSYTLQKFLNRSLGTEVDPKHEDIGKWLNKNQNLLAENKKYRVVIDTTASMDVQVGLTNLDSVEQSVPVVQTSLYSGGKMARYLVEGQGRNPRLDDFDCLLVDKAIDDSDLQNLIFGSNDGFDQIRIGEGCSSSTLKMSDAKVSLFAAGIAERLSKQLVSSFPEDGEMLIGRLDDMEMGAIWEWVTVPRFESLKTNDGWEVRIPENLISEMKEQLEQSKPNETGGILAGHINSMTLTITITRLIPPPADSEFSQIEFTLGTDGLKEEIINLSEKSNGHIAYVGTWHTHPKGGSASATDMATLKELVNVRSPIPTIGIIVSEQLQLIPGGSV